MSLSSRLKELYNPRAFITHAAWLDQACAHCPIFPTAASRRSLGRVSVPMWLIILSDQLWICLLYTSDAADEEDSVDLGGRRVLQKKKREGSWRERAMRSTEEEARATAHENG
eukprot:TRINITY_DN6830_c0_g1_i6.p2 TRINITY_DN6830_c0_g1~~TRINITY_DN6830_c0_g1_i6.p2  ORF type:complete len:113 (+),score=5.46 TRINITY_DN6830_c0_g1_i6:294-632(+)